MMTSLCSCRAVSLLESFLVFGNESTNFCFFSFVYVIITNNDVINGGPFLLLTYSCFFFMMTLSLRISFSTIRCRIRIRKLLRWMTCVRRWCLQCFSFSILRKCRLKPSGVSNFSNTRTSCEFISNIHLLCESFRLSLFYVLVYSILLVLLPLPFLLFSSALLLFPFFFFSSLLFFSSSPQCLPSCLAGYNWCGSNRSPKFSSPPYEEALSLLVLVLSQCFLRD